MQEKNVLVDDVLIREEEHIDMLLSLLQKMERTQLQMALY